MRTNTEFASTLLEKGASGYAGLAASMMLERNPDADSTNELAAWKSHITQRVLELSAALSVNQPQLFVNRAIWFRKALLARNIDERYVAVSLESLRDTLQERLPEVGRAAPVEYINLALETLKSGVASPDDGEPDADTPTGKQTLDYLQTVLEGNSAAAIDKLLDALQTGQSPASLYTEVLLPAQREIGRLWHIGNITIAEEHLVTSTSQRAMSVLAQRSPCKEANGKTLIAASVATNAHDIGIRAISDLYQMEGWRVIYLGSDVPAADIPKMISYFNADLLILSATLDTHLPQVKDTVREIRQRCEKSIEVMVGGYAFDQAPDMAKTVGADAYITSVIAAVEAGIKLAEG